MVYSDAGLLTNKPRYIRETHKTHAAAQVALTRLQRQVDGGTRLRSLGHYSATELLAAGVDLRTVAGRLGHGTDGAIMLEV